MHFEPCATYVEYDSSGGGRGVGETQGSSHRRDGNQLSYERQACILDNVGREVSKSVEHISNTSGKEQQLLLQVHNNRSALRALVKYEEITQQFVTNEKSENRAAESQQGIAELRLTEE